MSREESIDDQKVSPDDGKPFKRACAHCQASFWVNLKFQTDIAPESAWNICPRCVEAIANGTCSEGMMRSLGF